MRRLCALLLLAAACGKSSAARDVRQQLDELRALDRQARELQKLHDPLLEKFRAAQARGDRAEVERLNRQSQPLQQKRRNLIERRRAVTAALLARSEEGLKENPDDVAILDARSQLYELSNDPQKMLADMERLARLRPGDRTFAVRHASGLRALNRYGEARERLAPVLRAGPTNAHALAEDGLAAYCLDDYEAAARELDAAVKGELPEGLREAVDRTLPAARDRRGWWQKELGLRGRDERAQLPRVKLLTSKGEIVLELFEDDAPNTVANFVSLVEQRFYDGTRFHRVIPDFMAQGGDPNSRDEDPKNDGGGGPGYTFKDELEEGRFRRHFRGSLSMANSGPNTNGSQFFITHRPTEHLDGKHTVFGRVLSGLEVVDALAGGDVLREAVMLRARDHPYRPVVEK